MSQLNLTYNMSWDKYNYAQKLSGKTYTDLNGRTVDCSYVDITFSSTENFNKFYATAVEEGKDYGFVNDVLVDIQGSSPTGVKLHEQSSGKANTNYTFRINASTLGVGDGLYKSFRIGLYIQQYDGTWNYEYFFLTTESNGEHKNVELSDHNILQVPVVTN